MRSAKRTRTVTVRPGRDLARSRAAILSARWRSVGRNTRSSAGFLPIADCAPADRPDDASGFRGNRDFHASAASFRPLWDRAISRGTIPGFSPIGRWSGRRSRRAAPWSLAPRPTSARRAGREGNPARYGDRRPPAHRAWPPAMQFSPDVSSAPRRPRSEGQALPARAAGSPARFHGRTKRWVQPATSAKASSMETRSTRGVKSPITRMAASPSRR